MLKMATLGNISIHLNSPWHSPVQAWCLVFLGLMTGLVRCEISSCYKVGPAPEYSRMFYSSHSEVDQSWINSTVLDLVQPVPDYEECQVLCQVRKTTLHWNVSIWPVWRTLSGARPGLGLTRTTRTFLLLALCFPKSERWRLTNIVLGRVRESTRKT